MISMQILIYSLLIRLLLPKYLISFHLVLFWVFLVSWQIFLVSPHGLSTPRFSPHGPPPTSLYLGPLTGI